MATALIKAGDMAKALRRAQETDAGTRATSAE
jgi:hypothetical protein